MFHNSIRRSWPTSPCASPIHPNELSIGSIAVLGQGVRTNGRVYSLFYHRPWGIREQTPVAVGEWGAEAAGGESGEVGGGKQRLECARFHSNVEFGASSAAVES